jgi:hypothetical protein
MVPYYFLFHPQHKLSSTNPFHNLSERRTYHYHILGPTVHVHLDSGYITNIK